MVASMREFRAAAAARLVDLLREHQQDESALADGRVFQDGSRMRDGNARVPEGSVVRVYPAPLVEMELCVMHRDAHVLVAHKPAGLSTIPDQRGDRSSLLGLVASELGLAIDQVHPTSRLDRDVSGVVIFALTATMRAQLKAARELGTYERRYLAIASTPTPVKTRSRGAQRRNGARTHVGGSTALGLGSAALRSSEVLQWDWPIGANADARSQTVAGKDAVPASTRARVVAWANECGHPDRPSYAVLGVRPLTGRTHQIRVHSAFYGLPLLGDDVYGGSRRVVLANGTVHALERVALHAFAVTVPGYPAFVAELPQAMRSLWSLLGGTEQAWDMAAQCEIP
jgi:23S rRNA pseudouridine1911/1915/1917 synthase